MSSSRKKFQSGREVMETYIPGFALDKEATGRGDANSIEEQTGEIAAEKIVEEFGIRVRRKIEKRQGQSR